MASWRPHGTLDRCALGMFCGCLSNMICRYESQHASPCSRLYMCLFAMLDLTLLVCRTFIFGLWTLQGHDFESRAHDFKPSFRGCKPGSLSSSSTTKAPLLHLHGVSVIMGCSGVGLAIDQGAWQWGTWIGLAAIGPWPLRGIRAIPEWAALTQGTAAGPGPSPAGTVAVAIGAHADAAQLTLPHAVECGLCIYVGSQIARVIGVVSVA